MDDMQLNAVREALRKLRPLCRKCRGELSQYEMVISNGLCSSCQAYRSLMRKRWPARW